MGAGSQPAKLRRGDGVYGQEEAGLGSRTKSRRRSEE